jgi:hypothetical protein
MEMLFIAYFSSWETGVRVNGLCWKMIRRVVVRTVLKAAEEPRHLPMGISD